MDINVFWMRFLSSSPAPQLDGHDGCADGRRVCNRWHLSLWSVRWGAVIPDRVGPWRDNRSRWVTKLLKLSSSMLSPFFTVRSSFIFIPSPDFGIPFYPSLLPLRRRQSGPFSHFGPVSQVDLQSHSAQFNAVYWVHAGEKHFKGKMQTLISVYTLRVLFIYKWLIKLKMNNEYFKNNLLYVIDITII